MAGIVFALAVWLKTFPVLIIFILIGYLIMKRSSEGKGWVSPLLSAMSGAIMLTAVLFIPVWMNGEMGYAFSFLTSRSNGFDLGMLMVPMMTIVIMVLSFLDIMGRSNESLERRLFFYSFLIMAWSAIIVSGYQYLPTVIFAAIIVYYVMPIRLLNPVMHSVWMVGIIDVLIWELFSALYISSVYLGIFDVHAVVKSSIDIYDYLQSLLSPIGTLRFITSLMAVLLIALSAFSHRMPKWMREYIRKEDQL